MTTTPREEYVARLKAQLDRWNAEAAQWEARAAVAKSDARAKYGAQLDAFHAWREEARYTLRLLESASASAWKDLRNGADDVWDRMRDAMNAARTHFEKS